jgi:hypothetical protein
MRHEFAEKSPAEGKEVYPEYESRQLEEIPAEKKAKQTQLLQLLK